MNDRAFDTLTRRATLACTGGAALATLVPPVVTTAKKGKNRNRNKNKNMNKNDDKAKQKCQSQVGQCVDLVETTCTLDPLECLEVQECCEFAGRCDFSGFLNCLNLLET